MSGRESFYNWINIIQRLLWYYFSVWWLLVLQRRVTHRKRSPLYNSYIKLPQEGGKELIFSNTFTFSLTHKYHGDTKSEITPCSQHSICIAFSQSSLNSRSTCSPVSELSVMSHCHSWLNLLSWHGTVEAYTSHDLEPFRSKLNYKVNLTIYPHLKVHLLARSGAFDCQKASKLLCQLPFPRLRIKCPLQLSRSV